MMTMSQEVGVALRDARLAAGLSQTRLASAMHISIWTLSRVEHGTRRFDAGWLKLMPEGVRAPVAAVVKRIHRDEYWRLCGMQDVAAAG